MVILGIPAREHDVGAANLAAIGDGEPEHARVEIFHPRQVVNIKPDVAHAQRAPAGPRRYETLSAADMIGCLPTVFLKIRAAGSAAASSLDSMSAEWTIG